MRAAFGYSMDPDPVTATAVLRLIVLAHVAAVIPLVGALASGTELHGDPLLLAALAALIGGLAVAEVELSHQRDEPATAAALPAWPVSLASLLLLTLALTLANAALPTDVGWYGVLLVLPVVVAAFIGRPAYAAVVTGAAIAGFMASVAVAHQHGGHEAGAVFGFTSFALIAAGATGMLARAIARDRDELACLAEVAAVAARATTIEVGLAGSAEVIARGPVDGRPVEGVDVYRHDGARRSRLGLATCTWHDDDGPPPPGLDVATTAAEGVVLHGRGALIVTGDGGPVRYVLAIGLPVRRTGRDRRLCRAQLARLTLHLQVLVTRIHALEELEQISPTDELTGLPNRRAVLRHLELERSEAAGADGRLSVALVDLDALDEFRDRFGPPESDRLLTDLATMLSARVRGTDHVARFEGSTFCLVLPSTSSAGAVRLVDELHTWAALLRPGEPTTFSAGVAGWDGCEPIRSLLGRAEQALRSARTEGRDRTVVAPSEPLTGESTTDHAAAG